MFKHLAIVNKIHKQTEESENRIVLFCLLGSYQNTMSMIDKFNYKTNTVKKVVDTHELQYDFDDIVSLRRNMLSGKKTVIVVREFEHITKGIYNRFDTYLKTSEDKKRFNSKRRISEDKKRSKSNWSTSIFLHSHVLTDELKRFITRFRVNTFNIDNDKKIDKGLHSNVLDYRWAFDMSLKQISDTIDNVCNYNISHNKSHKYLVENTIVPRYKCAKKSSHQLSVDVCKDMNYRLFTSRSEDFDVKRMISNLETVQKKRNVQNLFAKQMVTYNSELCDNTRSEKSIINTIRKHKKMKTF